MSRSKVEPILMCLGISVLQTSLVFFSPLRKTSHLQKMIQICLYSDFDQITKFGK